MYAIRSYYDKRGEPTNIRPVLVLYLIGSLGAAMVGVIASFAFPTSLVLSAPQAAGTPPGGIFIVLNNLLMNAVSNPVKALMEANFIGILIWASLLGMALRHASQTTLTMLNDVSDAVSKIVRLVIRFAPFGIFGLVAATLANSGFAALLNYGRLLALIVGSMVFIVITSYSIHYTKLYDPPRGPGKPLLPNRYR